jgi:hypothetical protein
MSSQASNQPPGKIDQQVVSHTHFGGFEEDAGEESESGEVCPLYPHVWLNSQVF